MDKDKKINEIKNKEKDKCLFKRLLQLINPYQY